MYKSIETPKKMPRKVRRYTADEKKEILKKVEESGISDVFQKYNIPRSTIYTWLEQNRSDKQRELKPVKSSTANESEADTPPSLDTIKTTQPKKRKIQKRYTPSQKAEILEYTEKHGITKTSNDFNVSRYSIYSWQRQVKLAANGQGISPTSGPSVEEIERQRDKEILAEWGKHPGLGPSQISNQLRRRQIKVSVNTTRRVMEESGYRPPKVKREPHDKSFEAVRPNHLWHLDFVQRYINKASTFILIILDDHSRYVTGFGVADAETSDLVVETFEDAVKKHGKPEMVIHDKGSAFWSWRGISRFTSLLTELGIDQIVAKHKEWNGKLEVFNANIQKELFNVYRFYDLAEMNRRLATHLHWYNHQRTSHALGGLLVPADRYYGLADEVLAQIESGMGRVGFDSTDLRDRCLELFKVISANGTPEIWLMGKKILELK